MLISQIEAALHSLKPLTRNGGNCCDSMDARGYSGVPDLANPNQSDFT